MRTARETGGAPYDLRPWAHPVVWLGMMAVA